MDSPGRRHRRNEQLRLNFAVAAAVMAFKAVSGREHDAGIIADHGVCV
jgi:hypothetical protein